VLWNRWKRLLAAHPSIVFVLPIAVFLLIGSLEPTPQSVGRPGILTLPYAAYPAVYAIKIALTALAMLAVWPGYRQFPLRVEPLALVIGVIGVVIWIGLWKLRLERHVFSLLGSWANVGERSAYNPLAQLADRPAWAWTFLAVRLAGLALVVPIIEEFFLRGLVMRLFVDPDRWNDVPFGAVNRTAVLLGTLVPMTMHPQELLAAAVWFSLVTWLMIRTRNIWDCVVAHAVTNLLLGMYVLASGDWGLL